MMSRHLLTPASPMAPRPYRNGRPIYTPLAPRATALSTSWPERMPPSICTSISEPTASTMAGKASIDDCAPSSWRPPWLDTISASAPLATARRASSGSMMPLMMSLPPQRCLIHSTSAQDRLKSNCCWVQADSEDMSDTDVAWPTMLPEPRRCVPSMPATQRGLVAMLMILAMVSFGGADRPLRKSLWRWPSTCKSSVNTSAPHLAALARSIRRLMNSRSFMTYSWNQNGFVVFAATSSIEQMLMVDRVNGTPNFSAAWAARISPSACCMPVRPVGDRATGMETACPTMVEARLRFSRLTATRWRNLILAKSLLLARYVDSVQEPESA